MTADSTFTLSLMSIVGQPDTPQLQPLITPIAELLSQRLQSSTHNPRVGVACSGGVDSITLAACVLIVCERLSRAGDSLSLTCFTVDHGLFINSDVQAHQLSDFWTDHGIGCEVLTADPDLIRGGSGLEDGARTARYLLLSEAARRHKIDLMCIAHHAQDQAETMLMRLQSSAGLSGLRGIPPERGLFVRPWLHLHPSMIHAAHQYLKLPVFPDPTNADPRFLRNALRQRLHPVLGELFGPEWVTRAARSAQYLREDELALTSLITQLLEGALHIDHIAGRVTLTWAQGLTQTRAVTIAALRHVYQITLAHLTSPQSNRRRVREQLSLLEEVWRGDHNQKRSLPLGLIAWGGRGVLEISTAVSPIAIPHEVEIPIPSTHQRVCVIWGEWRLELIPDDDRAQGAYLERAQGPLKLCLPPPGARYRPHKAPGSKRIKRLWSDRKVSAQERVRLPVLIDDGGRILWAPHCRPAMWLCDPPKEINDAQERSWYLEWCLRDLT